ncbi:hypothetical protein LC1Hm_3280 [Halomicrobium sp. LC1Hm]|nr:hypothetical protein LC1Hm_3280 [Halomicrobium sp. LC1Hm]
MANQPNALSTLVTSSCRVAILRQIVRSPASIDELDSAIDSTRRSILRNLKRLQDDGWIDQSGAEYQVQSMVREYVQDIIQKIEQGNRIEEIQALLRNVSYNFDAVPKEILIESEISVRCPQAPTRPLNETISKIRSSKTVKLFVPFLSLQVARALQASVENDDKVSLVVSRDALRRLQSSDLEDAFKILLPLTYGHQCPVKPIGICNLEDESILMCYDEHGGLHGTFHGTFQSIREWSNERYRNQRDKARPIKTFDRRIQ